MSTMEVANRLVELCKAGKFIEAIEETHADDVVTVEAMEGGPTPRQLNGKDEVLKMAKWWEGAHEVHRFDVEGPWPHDDKFICTMDMEVTFKEGPMAGQRMPMKEACHYTVKDGKISRVEFYYAA